MTHLRARALLVGIRRREARPSGIFTRREPPGRAAGNLRPGSVPGWSPEPIRVSVG